MYAGSPAIRGARLAMKIFVSLRHLRHKLRFIIFEGYDVGRRTCVKGAAYASWKLPARVFTLFLSG